jgi:hypothetical protein
MGHGGHVRRANDRFLPATTSTPSPARARSRQDAQGASIARAKPRRRPTVPVALGRLYRSGQIDAGTFSGYRASWVAAGRSAQRLHGIRSLELKAVMANLQGMAVTGFLTPSRLPALFLTLDRNRQWWSTGPLLSSGQRVEFAGSKLVWQYYPGQGIELQVLATFGKADGLFTAGRSSYPQMQALLDEMIPLAASRAGGLAWEYYFHFDGGAPPWTSAMAQGTALEALSRAARAFGATAGPLGDTTSYLQIAQRALPLFTVAPPAGVRIRTPTGARYLQYSFAPRTDIINAYLQSLIGLYDYAQVSGDPEAAQLFAIGNMQAEAELPEFDTGAWSLYQPGVEDDLNYHELVTGFLQQLCARTGATSYCTAAQHFQQYLTTPPALSLLTTRLRTRHAGALSFRLSKASHVGVVVTRGNRTLLSTSASFAYGVHSFALPRLKGRGTLAVRMSATDLAGNFSRTTGTIVLGG